MMISSGCVPSSTRVIVAIPYPRRSHLNAMMNLCEQLVSKGEGRVHVIYIVTEEWLGLLSSQQYSTYNNPADVRISVLTIPNVLPSDQNRGSDESAGSIEAGYIKMAELMKQVLEKLLQSKRRPDMIIAESLMHWAVEVGVRRKIPVASFWVMNASYLSVLCSHKLITESQFYPIDITEEGHQRITFIPGISSIRLEDLPPEFRPSGEWLLKSYIDIIFSVSKAQFILLNTVDELENSAIEALRRTIIPQQPIFPIGPAVPYFNSKSDSSNKHNEESHSELPDYISWLNDQPERSVLYVSTGSFLSVTGAQLDQLAAGLRDSGKPILWAAREETAKLSTILGEKSKVIPWCDQMRVLIHPSVGGFLTHCGWNSTLEGTIAGVPVLTFPLDYEQAINSKLMVEDWGIGWRLKRNGYELVTKDEVCEAVRSFMDFTQNGRMLLDKNSKILKERLLQSMDENGTTCGLQAFVSEILSSVTTNQEKKFTN